jgi:hypothetical protein
VNRVNSACISEYLERGRRCVIGLTVPVFLSGEGVGLRRIGLGVPISRCPDKRRRLCRTG